MLKFKKITKTNGFDTNTPQMQYKIVMLGLWQNLMDTFMLELVEICSHPL